MERKKGRLAAELYRIARMGMEATEIVLPKVQDSTLRDHIRRQNAGYRNYARRAEALLARCGAEPKAQNGLEKMMLRGSARMGTLLNKNGGHIAEMMINGSAMGIISMTRTLNQSQGEDSAAKALAGEYLAQEQQNIDALKRHL